MTKITIAQLNRDEIGELEFAIASLIAFEGLAEDERQTIYDNLYRNDNGIAFAYLDANDRNNLIPII